MKKLQVTAQDVFEAITSISAALIASDPDGQMSPSQVAEAASEAVDHILDAVDKFVDRENE